MTNCPCGSTQEFNQCCEPFIKGAKSPPTAEQLMRSRYSAYTQAKISYIKKTMRGPALDGFNPQKSKTWAKQANWLSLEVVNTKAGQEQDEQGWVEYIATYQDPRGIRQLHELSEFKKIDGKWYYVDGEHYS